MMAGIFDDFFQGWTRSAIILAIPPAHWNRLKIVSHDKKERPQVVCALRIPGIARHPHVLLRIYASYDRHSDSHLLCGAHDHKLPPGVWFFS